MENKMRDDPTDSCRTPTKGLPDNDASSAAIDTDFSTVNFTVIR